MKVRKARELQEGKANKRLQKKGSRVRNKKISQGDPKNR
jgi:hypothetical protein